MYWVNAVQGYWFNESEDMENQTLKSVSDWEALTEEQKSYLVKKKQPLKSDGDIKADGGKLRYDLLPPKAIEGIAKIFTYGASKYDDNNWLKSEYPDRYYAACMRHLAEIRKGTIVDPESGLYHFDHAIVSLIMYRELYFKQQENGTRK